MEDHSFHKEAQNTTAFPSIGYQDLNFPEMVFLSKEGEHLTLAVLLAVPAALFHGLDIDDNVDDVLLQDVALAEDGAWTLGWARDTLFTENQLANANLRE